MIVQLTLTNDQVDLLFLPEEAELEGVKRNIRMCLAADASISLTDDQGRVHLYPGRSIRSVIITPSEEK